LKLKEKKLSKNNRQRAKWLHLSDEKEWKANEARIKCMSMRCRCAICARRWMLKALLMDLYRLKCNNNNRLHFYYFLPSLAFCKFLIFLFALFCDFVYIHFKSLKCHFRELSADLRGDISN
jgi:hypothetical protein